MSTNPPEMLTIKQINARSGLAEGCIRKWIWERRIPFGIAGSTKYLVNWERFCAFLSGEYESPAPTANGGIRKIR